MKRFQQVLKCKGGIVNKPLYQSNSTISQAVSDWDFIIQYPTKCFYSLIIESFLLIKHFNIYYLIYKEITKGDGENNPQMGKIKYKNQNENYLVKMHTSYILTHSACKFMHISLNL